MHSERLGKAIGLQKKSPIETSKREFGQDAANNNIVYFSIKPLFDKSKNLLGKENEHNWNKESRTPGIEARGNFYLPDKFSARGRDDKHSLPVSPVDYRRTHFLDDRNAHPPGTETNRSQRLLGQQVQRIDKEQVPLSATQAKLPGTQFSFNKFTKENIQKFTYLPTKERPAPNKNSSMISSKSYEILEAMNKGEEERSEEVRADELMKNKTLTNFSRIFEQAKSNKYSNSNFFVEEPKPDRPFPSHKQQPGLHSPDESFVFKNPADRSFVNAGIHGSPSQSNLRTKTFEKSKLSALNRSDISKNSNGNASFLTRREDGDTSKITGHPAESRCRNGMSKTWVKSGLMESREEISTISSSS